MTELREVPWVRVMRNYIGMNEHTKYGKKTLSRWLHHLGGSWLGVRAPWCGTAVAFALEQSGRWIPKHWYRAKAYNDPSAMTRLSRPAYGCIVVFNRIGGGHVGFVVGKTSDGKICVIGGNQGDRMTIKAFDPNRVLGYYWTSSRNGTKRVPYPKRYTLPILNADMSIKES